MVIRHWNRLPDDVVDAVLADGLLAYRRDLETLEGLARTNEHLRRVLGDTVRARLKEHGIAPNVPPKA